MALSNPASITHKACPPPTGEGRNSRSRTRERRMWERFCRNRGAVVGLLVLALFFSVAMLAPLATTYLHEENPVDQKLLEPTPAHLLGTDHLGRDILARLAYGARFSLLIGFAAVSVGLVIGATLCAVSGFYGGLLHLVIQAGVRARV